MPLKPLATSIVAKLQRAGHTAYFTGGWVRDLLLNHPSDDIDIATSATLDEIKALFPKTVPVGVAFGILLVLEGGHPFEVAMFRKDRGYLDGRRPQGVDPATPQEDAQRRDFTINGLFFDPLTETIYDYVEGRKDLERGLIRAIGNPHERFAEDRLRMIRAVRYSVRFGFPIESATKTAILAHAKELVPAVAMERVWQEFQKMDQMADFGKALVLLHELELLPVLFPSLKGVALPSVQAQVDCIRQWPQNTPVIAKLLELFPDASKADIENLCDLLKVPSRERKVAEELFHAKRLLQSNLEPFEWAKFYAQEHADLSLAIHCSHLPEAEKAPFLAEHHSRKAQLQTAIERMRQGTTLVKAADLMERGIAPGKEMGSILQKGERLAVNEGLCSKEEVLRRLGFS